MKWLLVLFSFFAAFLTFSYSGKILRAAKLRSCSGQDSQYFCNAPNGYFLFRGDEYSLDSVELWKRQASLGVKETEFALFSLGMYSFHVDKDYISAIEYFERVMADYPSESIAASAKFECGVCQMIAGFGEAGKRTLSKFCEGYPNSWRVPAARMYIGVFHRENGKLSDATEIFEQVALDYPESPQHERALRSLLEIYKNQGNTRDVERIVSLLDPYMKTEPSKIDSIKQRDPK